MEALTPRIPEFAHYYGDWIWDEELIGWIKSLLLFFDGIALALPSRKADRLIESSPVLAQPLAELGLLRNYGPDLWFEPYAEALKKRIADVTRMQRSLAQHFENPSDSELEDTDLEDARAAINELSHEIQYANNIRIAIEEAEVGPFWDQIFTEHKDNYSSSHMRAFRIGTISALLCRSITDISIEPVINDENAASFVASMIGPHDKGRAEIVIGDLAQIGIDLSAVPLDEVLDFRSKHGSEYRRYAKDVRSFILELSRMGEAERHSALMDRRLELRDQAEQLRKVVRTAFVRKAVFLGFGLAGAAWPLVPHGDPWVGAAFSAGAVIAGLTGRDREPIGASYTYILRAKTELTR